MLPGQTRPSVAQARRLEAGGALKTVFIPHAAPTLPRWFLNEWPSHYANTPPWAIDSAFWERRNRDGLPTCLVALVRDRPIGTVSLLETPICSRLFLGLGRGLCRRRAEHTAQPRSTGQPGHASGRSLEHVPPSPAATCQLCPVSRRAGRSIYNGSFSACRNSIT